MTASEEKQIENILMNFDFEKVHRVMVFLEWGWGRGENRRVPTLVELILYARRRLVEAVEKQLSGASSGGFVVERWVDGTLQLMFVVEDWEADPEGDDDGTNAEETQAEEAISEEADDPEQ